MQTKTMLRVSFALGGFIYEKYAEQMLDPCDFVHVQWSVESP
jgi:hypothetical protein